MRRRQRDWHSAAGRFLPPIEFLDPAEAGRPHQTRRFPSGVTTIGSNRFASMRSVRRSQ